jgi:hypothetical protein
VPSSLPRRPASLAMSTTANSSSRARVPSTPGPGTTPLPLRYTAAGRTRPAPRLPTGRPKRHGGANVVARGWAAPPLSSELRPSSDLHHGWGVRGAELVVGPNGGEATVVARVRVAGRTMADCGPPRATVLPAQKRSPHRRLTPHHKHRTAEQSGPSHRRTPPLTPGDSRCTSP